MNQLGVAVVWCAVQVAVVGAIAWLLMFAARRAAPRARATVAFASLLLVTLLSALALAPLPTWWDVLASVEIDNPATTSSVAASAAESGRTNDHPQPPSTASSKDGGTAMFVEEFFRQWREELRAEPAPHVAVSAGHARWWPAYVAGCFLFLSAVGVVQLTLGLLLVRGYRRASVAVYDRAVLELVDRLREELDCPRAVEVRQSSRLTTAATVGWLRPLILLPTQWRSWNAAELRAVLAHELAHIARSDYLACLCGQVGLLVHYYHPVVHWLVRRLRLEQELAADAAAASVAGGRTVYLRILAELALRQCDQRVPFPARSFLPTRSTFLRRIDMLRNPRCGAVRPSVAGQAATLLLLLVAAVGAAGLRGPAGLVVAAPQPPALPAAPAGEEAAARGRQPFDLRYIADDGGFVYAIRPASILSRPELGEFGKLLRDSKEFEETFGIPLDMIEEFIFTPPSPDDARRAEGEIPLVFQNIMIRTARPHDWKNLFDGVLENSTRREHAGKTYYEVSEKFGALAYFHPDDRTIVLHSSERIQSYLDGRRPRHSLLTGDVWNRVARDDVAVALNPELLSKLMGTPPGGPPTTNLALIRPVLDGSDALYFGANLDETLRIQALAACKSEAALKDVAETVSALLTLGKNLAREAQRGVSASPEPQAAITRAGLDVALKLLESAVVEQITLGKGDRKEFFIQIQGHADVDPDLAAPLAAATISARAAARRATAMNNLKQIGLAMHNYHDSHGHLPAASILGPDGKTPHSWRVALLPYLEQEELYKQYRFAEPWDSAHNKKLLEQMPAVYGSPTAKPGETNAYAFVLTGDDSAFPAAPAQEGPKFVDFRDGTSNTILVVDAVRDIPWTRPDDIPYTAGKPLPALGGVHEGGFLAGLADGSVRFITSVKTPEDERQVRALITRNGGEAIEP